MISKCFLVMVSMCSVPGKAKYDCYRDSEEMFPKLTTMQVYGQEWKKQNDTYMSGCREEGNCLGGITSASKSAFKFQCEDVGGRWCTINIVYQNVDFKASYNGKVVKEAHIMPFNHICIPYSCDQEHQDKLKAAFHCPPLYDYNPQCVLTLQCPDAGIGAGMITLIVAACLLFVSGISFGAFLCTKAPACEEGQCMEPFVNVDDDEGSDEEGEASVQPVQEK